MVSKLGYSAEYVDKLPPVERKIIHIYWEKEQEELRRRRERDDQSGGRGPTIGGSIGVDPGI